MSNERYVYLPEGADKTIAAALRQRARTLIYRDRDRDRETAERLRAFADRIDPRGAK